MANKNYTWLMLVAILGYIIGVIACVTVIGLIIGIPMIIGANRYAYWAKMSDEALQNEAQSMFGWTIFFCIFAFPFGLVALIPYLNLDADKIDTVENVKYTVSKKDPMQEKIDKIEKLAALKEKGLIDEDDFKVAKAKILSE
ncbi:MAG: SHOCT domain-containing protein [Clostridia bacterium]|jgi:hypothetical protein|nr:DUF5362 family protein [Clostridia bacterium]